MEIESGKPIKEFVKLISEEEVSYKPFVGGTISTLLENYGTYGLAWILRYDSKGVEVDRHNIKYVSQIIWQ